MSIILEGPDGSGKTSLFNKLNAHFVLEPVARFSTSEGGSLPNIAERTLHDSLRVDVSKRHIYDRHPIISEPIYRRVLQDRPLDLWFSTSQFYQAQSAIVKRSLIIVCLPDVTTGFKGAKRDVQMPGVLENYLALWNEYSSLLDFPHVLHYDYTNPHAFSTAMSAVANHIEGEEVV